MDPARANTQASWSLLDLTCARLMSYPDRAGSRAYGLVPEVAAAPPKTSRDGKTYTFTLRRGFRFSDGKPVDARAFARAINRTLTPNLKSLGTRYMQDIVGARAVQAGKRRVPAEWLRGDTAWSSASSDPSATSPRARACRSSAPSRRTSLPIRRVAVCSRDPARTGSRSTGPARGSRSCEIATTAAPGRTTSTGSASI